MSISRFTRTALVISATVMLFVSAVFTAQAQDTEATWVADLYIELSDQPISGCDLNENEYPVVLPMDGTLSAANADGVETDLNIPVEANTPFCIDNGQVSLISGVSMGDTIKDGYGVAAELRLNAADGVYRLTPSPAMQLDTHMGKQQGHQFIAIIREADGCRYVGANNYAEHGIRLWHRDGPGYVDVAMGELTTFCDVEYANPKAGDDMAFGASWFKIYQQLEAEVEINLATSTYIGDPVNIVTIDFPRTNDFGQVSLYADGVDVAYTETVHMRSQYSAFGSYCIDMGAAVGGVHCQFVATQLDLSTPGGHWVMIAAFPSAAVRTQIIAESGLESIDVPELPLVAYAVWVEAGS